MPVDPVSYDEFLYILGVLKKKYGKNYIKKEHVKSSIIDSITTYTWKNIGGLNIHLTRSFSDEANEVFVRYLHVETFLKTAKKLEADLLILEKRNLQEKQKKDDEKQRKKMNQLGGGL